MSFTSCLRGPKFAECELFVNLFAESNGLYGLNLVCYDCQEEMVLSKRV